MNQPLEMHRWLAFGSGVGIEIGEADLQIAIVRARPSGPRIVATAAIAGFRRRPAAEWGAEYAEFLRRHGVAHVPAMAVLPRSEVIARTITLPGVAKRDVDAALALQIDALHPWGEDEAAWGWSSIGKDGPLLVALLRRAVLDKYVELFTEAGIRLSHLTFSAAVLHPVLRMYTRPPSELLGWSRSGDALEVYGESQARPLFSSLFDVSEERAAAAARAELRLAPETEPVDVAEALPRPKELAKDQGPVSAWAYAAGLAAAAPLLARPVNLLPPNLRATTSRLRYVPTAALLVLLLAALGALAAVQPVEDRRYIKALATEIRKLETPARRAGDLDRAIESTRARSRLLDRFRGRTARDLAALDEVTRLVPPPAWAGQVELTRDTVVLGGETEQAVSLLKTLDASPAFSGSEFTVPLSRREQRELFRLRTVREGEK